MPGCRACSVVIGQSTREEFATVEPKEHSGGITGEASGGRREVGTAGAGGGSAIESCLAVRVWLQYITAATSSNFFDGRLLSSSVGERMHRAVVSANLPWS